MTEKTARITQGEKQEEKWNGSAKLPYKQDLKIFATEQRGCGIHKTEERQNSKNLSSFKYK